MKLNSLASIIESIVFPLHERIKGHSSFKWLETLEASQWWTPSRLIEFQDMRLKALIKSAEENPFYQSRLNADIALQSISFLDKQTIRDNIELMKAGRSDLIPYRTGGSSGEPLHFYVSRERIGHDIAARLRSMSWFDCHVGEKEVVLWGSPIENKKQTIMRRFRDCLIRSRLIDAQSLSIDKLTSIAEQIFNYQPSFIFSYPSLIYVLAKLIYEDGLKIKSNKLKAIFVTSEMLELFQRQLIEKVFEVPVVNGYGGRDGGFIAHECPHGNMHIGAEDVVVEIVDNNGQTVENEVGNIVVTHLESSAFPFIRYKIGDRGRLANYQCPCNRSLPILEALEGRSSDLIYDINGALVHRATIVDRITQFDDLRRFKFVQHRLNYSEILLEAKPSYIRDTKLNNSLKYILGANVDLRITCHDQLPQEPSGKFRFIVSHLRNNL